ncbi:PC4/YdbC family ssDNA-binding protein [Latilactobacillus sakei]
MSDINYKIMAEIGVISEDKAGRKKESNLIAWNGRAPKFDLRDWAPDHAKMGKGITLTNEEVAQLQTILNEMNLK